MSEPDAPASRMRSADRRELVLAAAAVMFGEFGYVGTTTARVAAAAGVSQPYVVRMFGTKEKLFLDVLHRSLERLLTAFREALADTESDVTLERRLALRYVGLIEDRGLLLTLMHGFVLGSDPEIGAAARGGFIEAYRFLREEAGFGAAEAQRFLADGMLINTMIGIRMGDAYSTDPLAKELLTESFPEGLDLLLALGTARGPGADQ